MLTLDDLRAAGGRLKVECVRCGHVDHRAASSLPVPGTAALDLIGLTLACRRCGVTACITTAQALPDPAGNLVIQAPDDGSA